MQTSILNPGLPTGSVIPGQVASINPLKVGSIVSLPPGSVVPVAVNGSVVPVRTIPAPPTTSVAPGTITRTSYTVPVTTRVVKTETVPVQPSIVRQSYTVPVTTTRVVQTPVAVPTPAVTTSVMAPTQSVVELPTPAVEQAAPTPTLRTLPPKIVRNELPSKYNTYNHSTTCYISCSSLANKDSINTSSSSNCQSFSTYLNCCSICINAYICYLKY